MTKCYVELFFQEWRHAPFSDSSVICWQRNPTHGNCSICFFISCYLNFQTWQLLSPMGKIVHLGKVKYKQLFSIKNQYIFRFIYMSIVLLKLSVLFWELPLSAETGSRFQNLNCFGHLIQNVTPFNFLIYPVLLCTAQVIIHLYSFLMLQFERFSSISEFMVRSHISEIYFSNLSA